MANPGDVVVGTLALAGAFFASKIPVVGTQAALLLGSYGAGKIWSGMKGEARETVARKIEGQKYNVTSTQAPLPIVYGIARIGIKTVDTRIIVRGTNNGGPSSTTPDAEPTDIFAGADNNDVLCIVGAFALGSEDGSGVQAIDDIRMYDDGTNVVVGPAAFSSAPLATGVITKYASDLKYTLEPGDDAQTTQTDLENSLGWTANGDAVAGRGISYGAFYVNYNEEVWDKGFPQITAEVTGNRVYDPRNPTGGPNADGWINYAASGASADNPALCILDYLTSKRYGAGIPYAARDGGTLDFIDEQSFEDAANYCDQLVSIPGPSTEKRFRMNAVVSGNRTTGANLRQMLATCRGELVWQNGTYRLLIREAKAADAFELTEDNIAGELHWVRKGTTVPNIIEATFPDDQTGDYIANTVVFPPVGTTTYLDEDNGMENRFEIALPYTSGRYQAERTIQVMLKESRADTICSLVAHQSAYTLQVNDVVRVTHEGPGWVQKEFWVRQVALTPEGLVRLALQEYDSTAYTLAASAAEDPLDDTELPNPLRPYITSVIVDDRFVSKGEVSATTGTQRWYRRLRFRTGAGTKSLRLVYSFDRPTVGGGSTTISRDYNINVTADSLVTVFLEDGASASQEFWAQDDSGTTIYDTAFAVTVTPNSENALAGENGTVIVSDTLSLEDEDDVGIRLDAEISTAFTEYDLSNRDAWFSFAAGAEYVAQEFTVPSGGRNIRSAIFRLRAIGTPVGAINSYIYSTDTTPTPDEPNAALKTGTSVQADSVTTDSAGADVEFFFDDYTLAAGNYWIVIETFPQVSNNIDVGVDNSTPSYGLFSSADEFFTWTSLSTRACARFAVTETTLQKVPARDLTTQSGLKATWLPSDGRVALSLSGSASGGGGVGTHGLTDHTDVSLTPSSGSQGEVLYRGVSAWENSGRLTMSEDGTIAAPTYSWLADPDTGFRLSTTAEIRAVIAGADELRLTASVLGPVVDAGLDLATTTERFGTAYIDTLDVTNTLLAAQINLGDGIRNTGTAVTFDADGLNDPDVAVESIDRFVMSDDGVNAKVRPIRIPLSLFNDDIGAGPPVAGTGIQVVTNTVSVEYDTAANFISAATGGLLAGAGLDAADRVAIADQTDNEVHYTSLSDLEGYWTIAAGSQITGVLPLANGGTGQNLADPGADRILFWDDAPTGQVDWLEAGGGLSISTTTLSVSAADGVQVTGGNVQLDFIGLGSNTVPIAADSFAFYDSVNTDHDRVLVSSMPLHLMDNATAGFLTAALTGSGAGLTDDGTNVSVDYAGVDNVILEATEYIGSILSTEHVLVSRADNTVYYTDVASLPFIVDVVGGAGLAESGTSTITLSVNAADGVRVTGDNVQLDVGNLTNLAPVATDSMVYYDDTAADHKRTLVSAMPLHLMDNATAGFTANAFSIAGDGLISPSAGTVAVDYVGTDNYILEAPDLRGTGISTSASIAYSDASNNVQYGNVSDLPFASSTHTHPASDITEGTFGTGDYVFPDVLTVQDRLVVTGVGPHGIGTTVSTNLQVLQSGAFTAVGGSAASAYRMNTQLTGNTGNTTRLTLWEIGGSASITTPAAAITVADVASMFLDEPNISLGAGSAVTNASTLKIAAAPTEGTNNYALWVAGGTTRFSGNVYLEASTPRLYFKETGGPPPVDEKLYRMVVSNSDFFFQTRTDADGTGVNIFQVVRGTGTAVTGINFTTSIRPNATSTRDLGTTSLRWANAYVDTLTLTNALAYNMGGTGLSDSPPNDQLLVSLGPGNGWDASGDLTYNSSSGLNLGGTGLDITISGTGRFEGDGSGLTGVSSDSSTIAQATPDGDFYPMLADGTTGTISHFQDSSNLRYNLASGVGTLEAERYQIGTDGTMLAVQDADRFGNGGWRFQGSNANQVSAVSMAPTGTQDRAIFRLYNDSDTANTEALEIEVDGTFARIRAGQNFGTGATDMTEFYINNANSASTSSLRLQVAGTDHLIAGAGAGGSSWVYVPGVLRVGNELRLADGSVGDPSLAFTSQETTGLYYTTSTINLGVSGNNIAKFGGSRVDLAVGLDINSGAGALSIGPGASDHVYMEFYADTAAPTARSGYIGYGTSGTNVLDINNEMGGALNLRASTTGGDINFYPNASVAWTIDATSGGDILPSTNEAYDIGSTTNRVNDLWASYYYVKRADDHPVVQGIRDDGTITNVDHLLRLIAQGDLGSGAATSARIDMTADQTWVQGTARGARITFHTTANDTWASPPERMRIDHDGQVGIGETNPASLLHLSSPTGANMMRIQDTGGAGSAANPYFDFADSASTRLAYVGMGSTNNSRLYLNNDTAGSHIYAQFASSATSGDLYLHNTGTTDVPTLLFSNADGTKGYLQTTDSGAVTLATNVANASISLRDNGSSFNLATFDHNGSFITTLNAPTGVTGVLRLNTVDATGSPYVTWSQNNTQRAYIQFVDSSDLFRINLSSSTSHNFAIQLGGQNRFYIDGTGSTTGRYWFDLGQVYNTEGAEITRSTAGSVTLDWDAYNQVDLRNDGNIDTINIDDGSMQDGGHYVLVIRYATSGQTSITFSATGTLQWQGGSAPTLPNSTVGDRTVITFVKTGGLTLGFYADAPA